MSDLKELVQGKIYYFKYKTEEQEVLCRLDSPGFPLIERSKKITAIFTELTRSHYPGTKTVFHTSMTDLN